MRKTILITGAAGFIGKNLSEHLKNTYYLLKPSRTELELLNSGEVYRYIEKNNIDTVIHTAIHSDARNSTEDQSKVFRNNIEMFFNIARCSKLFRRMLYFGSGAEYARDSLPFMVKENYFDRNIPLTDYGYSKYLMAKFCEKIPNIFDLRLFGCFGKYEDYRIRFISNAICRSLFNVHILIKQNIQFSYIYITDLCRIIERFIKIEKLPYSHYNICSNKPYKLIDLAKLIKKLTNNNINITLHNKTMATPYTGNNQRLNSILVNFSYTSMEEAIIELFEWYKKRKTKINKESLLFDE